MVALALSNVFLNFLDIMAISMIGFIGAFAFEQSVNLPFVDLSDFDRDSIFVFSLAATAILFCLKTGGGLLLARIQFTFLARIESGFSEQIAKHVLGSNLVAMKRFSRSEIEWSILRSTAIAFPTILGTGLTLIAQASLALFIFSLFVYADWVSALLVFAYFAALLFVFHLFSGKRAKRTGLLYTTGSVSVSQAITDSVSAFKEIAVLSRLNFFVRRISDARTRVAMAQAAQQHLQAMPRLLTELGLIVGAIAFLLFQFVRTDGNLNIGLLSIFLVGSLRMMSALIPLQRAAMDFRFFAPQALESQKLLRESLNSQNHEDVPGNAGPTQSAFGAGHREGAPTVELSNVGFAYVDGERRDVALQDVSLIIKPGQTVALIGPSGAGKSTIADLILGLHEPSSGQILLGRIPPKEFRTMNPGAVGYVPQKPGLISGSIRDNVALGLPPESIDEKALWKALKQAQIDEFVLALPEGVDSNLGKHSDSLSGGQLQRIGLARALYTKPRLLVLDEATSALDAEIEASISLSLQNLETETTMIIVAHRLSTIQGADVVIAVDAGRIVATGSFKDLQNSSPLVRKYVSLMTIR